MTTFTLDDTRKTRITLWKVIGFFVCLGAAIWAWQTESSEETTAPLSAEATTLIEMARQRPDLLAREMLTLVYQAFEADTEDAIYDALAAATAGPVLEELYLQRRAALLQGDGAVQAVHDITLNRLSAEWVSDRAVVMEADWQVLGTVGHAEHQHQRGNSYAATVTFALLGEGFRVTGFDLRDVRRDPNAGDVYEAPGE